MESAKLRILAFAAVASALTGTSIARAQTQTVTSDINYVTLAPLSFSTIADPEFGYVKQGVAAHYVLSTAGAVTSPDGGVTEGGPTTHAGHYKISGSSTHPLSISAVGGYSTDGGSTTSAATCIYDGNTLFADCTGNGQSAPDTGKDLVVGLTIASDGTTPDGVADHPTVTITVIYQ